MAARDCNWLPQETDIFQNTAKVKSTIDMFCSPRQSLEFHFLCHYGDGSLMFKTLLTFGESHFHEVCLGVQQSQILMMFLNVSLLSNNGMSGMTFLMNNYKKPNYFCLSSLKIIMFFHTYLFQLYLNVSIIVTLKNILRSFRWQFSHPLLKFCSPVYLFSTYYPYFYKDGKNQYILKKKIGSIKISIYYCQDSGHTFQISSVKPHKYIYIDPFGSIDEYQVKNLFKKISIS